MKKIFALMAVAALFASCAQTEDLNEAYENEVAPKAIAFSTYIDKQTKGNVENSDENYSDVMSLHHDTYQVWGYKTVSTTNYDVFENTEVTSATGAYSPTKYWDKAASSYGFFACAGDATFTLADGTKTDDMSDDYFTITGFTVPETNLNATAAGTEEATSFKTIPGKDLMIAAPCSHNNYTAAVQLNFIHILSRLNVKVKTTSSATIKLYALKVHNLVSNGAFDENTDLTSTGTTLKEGTSYRWTRTTPTYIDNIFDKPSDPFTVKAEPYYVMQALVMPQIAEYQAIDIDGTDAESYGPYIEITYSVTTGGVEQPKCTYYYNLADAFGSADLPFNEGWQNTLTIDINPGAIAFSANVAKWDGAPEGSLTVQ